MKLPQYTSVKIEGPRGTANVSVDSFVDILRSRARLVSSAAMDVNLDEKDIYLLQGAYAEIQAILRVFENHVQAATDFTR